MKYTKTQLNKMTINQLQSISDNLDGVRTIWSGASKKEIINHILHKQLEKRV